MTHHTQTIVLRHRKENLKKCSLRGLEGRSDFVFFTYPTSVLPELKKTLVLSMGAPVISEKDAHLDLFMLDATWSKAGAMMKSLEGSGGVLEQMIPRGLPEGFKTAYPRRQLDCPEPSKGLASIEAIYIAYHLMGKNTEGLLDHYYWKDDFLELNQDLLNAPGVPQGGS